MKLVGQVSRPRRGVRKKAAENLGPPPAGPHIDRAILLASPHRVGPEVDRFTPQFDLVFTAGVAVDRVSRRFVGIDFEEPFPLGAGGLLRCRVVLGERRLAGHGGQHDEEPGRTHWFNLNSDVGRLQIVSSDYIFGRSGGVVNEILQIFVWRELLEGNRPIVL